MANKMLIDATHPEETRVVVLRGNRVEEFDFESAHRRQLRGNIYLAKVTRVEPSLQAAFVDYGGNRHGFLAFSEIHPDYYQIPVADRQALIAEEERAHRAAEAEADRRAQRQRPQRQAAASADDAVRSEPIEALSEAETAVAPHETAVDEAHDDAHDEAAEQSASEASAGAAQTNEHDEHHELERREDEHRDDHHEDHHHDAEQADAGQALAAAEPVDATEASAEPVEGHGENAERAEHAGENGNAPAEVVEEEVVDTVGGDALEEVQERLPRYRRQYKIQEVIKRRQVMLVQVVKEERGTKGAALTTYLSLAGRYSVLMPNTARGGGISRKITNVQDRKRLKELAQDLEVPEGMGVILRTAGASRTKTEIKRDFEYLLRLWETVRDLTLKSTAPKLVYEEGSLIKRSIRDLYGKEIDEVIAAGDDGFEEAKDFMRMLMPSHAKNVKAYRDAQPLFSRYGIESQLDAMFTPVMQLKSGGYIVLNQTEALVSIDVNSGRATREHHIEDTALKTNLEAAEEIARQLRLRDLAGLIVIDFIDMDEKRNNRLVERRLKEALKHDRARIQVGRISHFGLLEMSRQRIRTSVLESSTETCVHCGGTGHVRSVSSVALQLLRVLEETLLRGATHNLIVRTRSEVALYVLNHKRAHLRELEARFRVTLTVNADPTIAGQQQFVIEKGEQVHTLEQAKAFVVQPMTVAPEAEEDVEDLSDELEDEESFADMEAPAAEQDEPADRAFGDRGEGQRGEGGRRRRRRRRRGRRGEGPEGGFTQEAAEEHGGAHDTEYNGADEATSTGVEAGPREHAHDAGPHEDAHDHEGAEAGDGEGNGEGNGEGGEGRRRRRRGRRGGRRNRRGREGEAPNSAAAEAGEPFEPEVGRAAADFDTAPPDHEHRGYEPPDHAPPASASEPPYHAPAPEPEPQPVAHQSPAEAADELHHAEAEAPRRRSTVRERAPLGGEGGADPAPAPAAEAPPPAITVVSPEKGDEASQPRRAGWWSRRFAGGDKG